MTISFGNIKEIFSWIFVLKVVTDPDHSLYSFCAVPPLFRKKRKKPTHLIYLSSWNASMLMKRNITSYFSSWFMWSLMQEYSLVFALLLSIVESGHLMNYFWVDCFTSRLCTVSPTYITHYNTTLCSWNLPQGIQNLKTEDVVGKIIIVNASLDQWEQNTQLIHNWYKYIFQK